jgi:hypothetical protein
LLKIANERIEIGYNLVVILLCWRHVLNRVRLDY